MPKLSIIIPTFNSGARIKACLRSVSAQTFGDYEVVVQDGGSSDGTLKEIAEFKKANSGIEVEVESQKDKGPYDAMNRAVRRAKGEWLYFLGSDDTLHDDRVLQSIFDRQDLANCDLMYGNVKVIGETPWAKDRVYGGAFTFERFLMQNISHQAIFYRASFVKRVGSFNTSYASCADWDFNMRCWTKTKFEYVDIVVADFRGGGISSVGRDDCFKKEVGANVLKYFNVSLWHPALLTPEFMGFTEIAKIRESKISLKRAASRIRRVIRRKTYG